MMTGTPGLRPRGPGDSEVLYRIYASTRAEELAPVPWDEATKEAFLRSQFTAQDTHYRATYPHASYDLIVTGGDTAGAEPSGEEILGRLYLDRGEHFWHIIDIALLPAHRGRGLGTRLLTQLLREADAAAKPVQIYVERFNPAQHLYARLGFRQLEDQGVYLLLERPPTAAGT